MIVSDRHSNHDLINGAEFWQAGQPGYALLTYLSDPDDWSAIVAIISSEIAGAVGGARFAKVLDIGSGVGTTSLQIARRLLASEGIMSAWTLVEPDDEARSASSKVFAVSAHGYGSARVISSIGQIDPDERYDCALFVHSSYYLDEFSQVLEGVASVLKCGAPIIIVSMVKESPFFLGGAIDNHRNLADQIVEITAQLGWRHERRPVTSRIAVPEGLWDNDDIVADWLELTQSSSLGKVEMQRLLRLYLQDGANLRDTIITIYPKP